MKILDKYKQLPIWIRFILNVSILYGIWSIFYIFLRNWWLIDYIYEEGIYWLTFIQLQSSRILLSLFDFDVTVLGKVISVNDSPGILLDRGCLGRNVLGVFVGFILAYPSELRRKIGIILIGIAVFLLLNILRISALAAIDYCCPQYLDINHHYVFKLVVYGAILLMWALWLRSLRQPQEP